MKIHYLLIILLSLLLFLCNCEENSKNDSKLSKEELKKVEVEEKYGKTQSTLADDPEEIKKRREENEKKMQKKIDESIKQLGIGERKIISKKEFKKIFGLLLEEGLNQALDDDPKNETKNEKKKKEEAGIIQAFADQIFEKLTKDSGDNIEIDKIMSYFEPEKILSALKDILSVFGLDKLIDDIAGPQLRKMGEQVKKDEEEKNKNKTKHNSDL